MPAVQPRHPPIEPPAGLHPTSVAFAARAGLLLAGFAAPGRRAGAVRLLSTDGRVRVDIAVRGAVSNVALDARARAAAIVRSIHLDDGSDGTRVELWSLDAPRPEKPLGRVAVAGAETATDVAISPDGRRLLVTTVYGLARVFDAVTRKPLRTLAGGTLAHPGSEAFYRGAFSPNGETVAVAGSRDVRLWDARSGIERGFRLSGHTSVLRSVAFSTDGHRIVTASADGTVRVWDARDGTALAVLGRHAGRVNGAAFLANGWIVSGGDDRTVRAYPCESCGPSGSLVGIAERHVTREPSNLGARGRRQRTAASRHRPTP